MDIQGLRTRYLLCLSIIYWTSVRYLMGVYGIDSTWIQKWYSTYTLIINILHGYSVHWMGRFFSWQVASILSGPFFFDHHFPTKSHPPRGKKSARPWHLGQIRQQSARWIGNILQQFQHWTWRSNPGTRKNWYPTEAAPLWGSHCIVALEQVLDFLSPRVQVMVVPMGDDPKATRVWHQNQS